MVQPRNARSVGPFHTNLLAVCALLADQLSSIIERFGFVKTSSLPRAPAVNPAVTSLFLLVLSRLQAHLIAS